MDLLNSISSPRFWNKHGMVAAWSVAVLSLMMVLGGIGWTSYSFLKEKKQNYQQQKIAPIAQQTKKSYRVTDIVAANLFGDPKPKIIVEKAPQTTLNLKLQGILWADDQQFARAIIQNGKNKSELYSVGEQIKGSGASVKEIRSDEVLINRNGATESLPLVKSNKSGKGELISFSNTTAAREVDSAQGGSGMKNSNRFAAVKTSRATGVQSPNGASRKVRKPNFSGMDRALRKQGEL